jgi:histidinol-phosphate aminotransferase
MYLNNPALLSYETYVPGLPREQIAAQFDIPLEDVAKLGSAENPFGPSPLAVEAVGGALSRIDIYPNWRADALREKIAEKFDVDPACVICGAGETEIISWIVRTFAAPEDSILMYEPCFPMYHLSADAEVRNGIYVPMGTDFDFRIEDYVAALDDTVRVAFLTNPHSPSGKLMALNDIRTVCRAAGDDRLVVLDEAYIHFTQTDGGMALLEEFSNLIVLRTFSKAYGLAGLRIGFGIGHPDMIKALLAVKPTWNMGQLQVAGAVAALDDDAHVRRTVDMIREMRDYVTERLGRLNSFRIIPGSRSNFFLVEIMDPDQNSTGVFEALLRKGVITKDCSQSFRGLGDRYLRVDVSLKRHMDRFVDALSELDVSEGAAA